VDARSSTGGSLITRRHARLRCARASNPAFLCFAECALSSNETDGQPDPECGGQAPQCSDFNVRIIRVFQQRYARLLHTRPFGQFLLRPARGLPQHCELDCDRIRRVGIAVNLRQSARLPADRRGRSVAPIIGMHLSTPARLTKVEEALVPH
jgi:hypothetical protein